VTVAIQATRQGPWTPVGSLQPSVLNPTGDLRGDGFPGRATVGPRACVAWVSPSDEALRFALGGGDVWWGGGWLVSPAPVGVPVVTGVPGGWMLAWADAGGTATQAWVASIAADGTPGTAPMSIADGALVGVATTGETQHVITIDQDGSLVDTLVTAQLIIEPTPLPVPILFRRSSVVLAVTAITDPQPIVTYRRGRSQVALGGQIHAPGAAPIILRGRARTHSAWPDVRVHEGTRPQGETFALVTWWMTPQELQFVELDEDGPVMPVETLETRGLAAYPQSLVEQAVRTVRER
jgi:hypothetical protein